MPEQHIDNEKIPTRLIGAIVAVGSLAFIGILTETVMTVLFPALMREFHVDTATVQWITTIYLLAVAATMPISSFLKRRFALKTIFLAAVILAIVGSLIMIVAQAFPLLIVARIIQGIGSGVATPLMINIILEQSPRSKIGRLMGVGSLVITVAPAIGPTVGGAVTTVLPWRAIFVIAIPLVLIAACIGMKCIEQKTPTEAAYLDPIQLGSIVVALVGLVLGDVNAGLAVGATLELAFMGNVTIGAALPPEITAGGILGTALAIVSGNGTEAALALALPIATVALLIKNTFYLTARSWFLHKSDQYAAEGNAAGVNAMHMISFLSYDIVMSLVIAICFYCGSDAVQSFLAIIPAFIIRGISVAAGILPALGFAMLGKILISPKVAPYFLLGFLLFQLLFQHRPFRFDSQVNALKVRFG